MSLTPGEQQFKFAATSGDLDATWLIPRKPRAMLLLAHGAGADHRHASMQAIAEHFAEIGLASLRFNFPYMQAGKRRVDNQATATDTIAQAAALCRDASNLPLFLGGHSFGGRMASHAVLDHTIDCRGLMFCSFPLHPAKKPARSRAQHLVDVPVPMLFLSGTRDDLADVTLLNEVVDELPAATLHWLDTGNHSYVPLKRSRTSPLSIFAEMAQSADAWLTRVLQN